MRFHNFSFTFASESEKGTDIRARTGKRGCHRRQPSAKARPAALHRPRQIRRLGPRSTRFPTPRESYQLATTKVYPVTLFRRAKPTDAYFATALTEAEARLALAGYRLGEALNAILR